MPTKRREFLKAGLASSLFLPLPYARVWAQSEGSVRLIRAPKVALVIGNGKYKDAPALKNAPNDAKAVGETLKAAGFEVTMKLDTGREEMIEAIRAYVHLMEQRKHVGLFYFAGHGVQLAWRNYLLPVDAVIDKIEDVAKQSVDLARLMEGLTKAANPMNVIILDACRENPFGKDFRVEQKGLSQMDAPASTLLAYATSPGNVASDGDGVNGLYTENLLKEIKVPEARIEDVFKRVRLAVRRKTNGAQIPWECTSLEEDFWFIPPKELKKASDAEKDKAFKEEAGLWDRIQKSTEPVPFEDYLRRYPNGHFSELAQLQLDRVLAKQGEKKIEIVNSAANPFTKGSAVANTAFKVGDSYQYRVLDPFSKAVQVTYSAEITRINEYEVTFSNGEAVDLLGSLLQNRQGLRLSSNQILPLEYAVGKRWTTRYSVFDRGGTATADFDGHVVTRERITVPAGTFDAFKMEYRGSVSGNFGRLEISTVIYRAPEIIRANLVFQIIRRNRGVPVHAERTELVSYKQA